MFCGGKQVVSSILSRQKPVCPQRVFPREVDQRKLPAFMRTDVLHGQGQRLAPRGVFALRGSGLVQTDDDIAVPLMDALTFGVLQQPLRIVPAQEQRYGTTQIYCTAFLRRFADLLHSYAGWTVRRAPGASAGK